MSGHVIKIFLQKKRLIYLQTVETLIRCRIFCVWTRSDLFANYPFAVSRLKSASQSIISQSFMLSLFDNNFLKFPPRSLGHCSTEHVLSRNVYISASIKSNTAYVHFEVSLSLNNDASGTRQSAQWGTYTPDHCHFFKEHKVCSFDSGDGSCMLYVITLKKNQSHIIWSPWPQGSSTGAGIELNKTLAL